jgi:hypothetical protein
MGLGQPPPVTWYPRARLAAFVRSWPRTLGVNVPRHVRPAKSVRRADRRVASPPWVLLPICLHESAIGTSKAFLSDVLWGQFCLFEFVRMQDDVLDGQAASPRLLFVADEFLLESERVFRRHLSQDRFWRFYRKSLLATTRGVLDAHRLQTRGGVPRHSWHVYAEVASIFKVGAAAICMSHGLDRAFLRTSRFMDHIAIADQLIDDLDDIDEDLRHGRINAAARWILGPSVRVEQARSRIGELAFRTDRVNTLLGHVRTHVDCARRVLAPLKFSAAARYLHVFGRHVDAIERRVHHARVDALMAAVRDRAGLGAA